MSVTTMYGDADVRALAGEPSYGRGVAYADEGRVTELQWFGSRTRLFGQVRGRERSSYAVSIQLRSDDETMSILRGSCSCPVRENCKHVVAVLVQAIREEGDGGLTGKPGTRSAGDSAGESAGASAGDSGLPEWRRMLEPLLPDPNHRVIGIPLGLQFELLPGEAVRRASGTYNSYRPAPEPRPRLGVRPVRMGDRDRYVRTGMSWSDLAHLQYRHDYDDVQLEILREVQGLLAGHGAASYYTPDTWLYIDSCRSEAIWAALHGGVRAGIGLVHGDRDQTPVTVLDAAAAASIDVASSDDGLELRSLVRINGSPVDGSFGFIGDPAVGLYLWNDDQDAPAQTAVGAAARTAAERPRTGRTPKRAPGAAGPNELRSTIVSLVPFAEPLASSARTFLLTRDPIRIPAAEESAFLTEHYQRLRQVFEIVSSDSSFEQPEMPEPRLGLTVEYRPGAVIAGRWWWSYGVPTSRGDRSSAEHLPLYPGETGAEFRDAVAEERILATLDITGDDWPALVRPAHGQPVARLLRSQFEVRGMQSVDFSRGLLAELQERPDIDVEVIGEAVDYRPADSAPIVSVATVAQKGSRDWFNLEIAVSVGGEDVPFNEIFLALGRGEQFMVLPSGVYFELDEERFGQLRELIAEARELGDDPSGGLRISRFQSSLWDELVELGVIDRQAAAWRRAVSGLSTSGTLETQPVPAGFNAPLRPYQQSGFDWLSFLFDNELGGILADDMGLGKTVQSLALIARAAEKGGKPFLVVAPTSVVPNWVSEAHRFAPGLRAVGIDQTSAKRGTALSAVIGDAQLVVTSYALFRLDYASYESVQFAGLLLDEAQFVKNRQAATHQLVRRLDTPFKLAITGTPMENNVMELWSLLSIVAPGLFPSPAMFAEFYQKPIEREGDREKLAQLRRRIRPLMLRRTKELVATELPPKQEQTIEVELGARQRKVYDTYLARERQRVLGLIGDFDKNRFAIFRALTTLRQIALDAALVDDAHTGVPSTKLDLLDELLADALAEGHRVLVFSQFTRFLGKVRGRLDTAGVPYAYLDGTTKNRGDVIESFRSGEAGVFLISLKAGGFGLNLTEADYCVLLDPWWNPATEAQAVDRAHRIGQDRSVMVYRLVAKDTIEEKVMALKAAKAELFAAVMSDDAEVGSAGISAEDVRELLGA